jgi:hypothetical protein
MHEHLQLLSLLLQLHLQLVVLQVEAQAFGEAVTHRKQPLLQGFRPGQLSGFHKYCTQQHPALAHGQPAAVFRRPAQIAVAGEGGKRPVGTWPVPHWDQIRFSRAARFGDVHHHGCHITAVGELGQLKLHQAQKPFGDRHLDVGCSASRKGQKKFRMT